MLSPAGKIFAFLCKYPMSSFSYRELERRTGISIGTVSRYVKELESVGLVTTRDVANAILVSARTDNEDFVHLKRARNLESLYTSGLVQFLVESLRPDSLVVFGSYSLGEDLEESDIDIAVIHGRDKDLDLSTYEDELVRQINLTRIKGMGCVSSEFKNSLANGIVISGSLEVIC
tara:strand:- start:453 stop:977 length:525 start_codon:yes stop_codon:yes gene_type:complete